jgi:hypothetical protein
VITIDGEPVSPGDDDDAAKAARAARQELKLCKALAALDPPGSLASIVYGRIAGHLRALNYDNLTDPGARQPADLTTTSFARQP